MSSIYGEKLKISVFGESHGAGIGVVIDGILPGVEIDLEEVQFQMSRRSPGGVEGSTKRDEADKFEILSGMLENRTTGAPLCAFIRNTNTRSGDYGNIALLPRPSHADYTGFVRYNGFNDIRGGGHFSGRLTAPIVFAGSVCRQILEKKGIMIGAHIYSVGSVKDTPFTDCEIPSELLKSLTRERFCTIDKEAAEKMKVEIEKARLQADSIGGIVECAVTGLPAGIGSPMFETVEGRLASMMFSVPAVKGIEFGKGFEISEMLGSQANDPFYYDENGEVKTKTNNNGGILGGITTGMPLIFRTAIKPTSSIGKEQDTINLSEKKNDKLIIKGRHDSCIAVRAVPVIEAAAAVAVTDILLSEGFFSQRED